MVGGYPNWATKYFLDALMLQERLSGSEKPAKHHKAEISAASTRTESMLEEVE
jgi:hypothetical protein